MKLILPVAEAEAIKKRQRRYKQPRPPPIQTMLELAGQMKNRLDQTPGLKRAALASELNMNPTYLTRHLNLLKLTPEIQEYIGGLPLSLTKGPITERRLMPLARMTNQVEQNRLFQEMLVAGLADKSK